jgi:hypothetical protein
MVVSCCVCSDIQQSSFGLLCAHNLESIDPISSASPAGKWAGQCLYRRFQGILNDKTLFILVFLKILFLWKVKIKFWFWFIYLIQFVLQVQRVRIFHNFSLVEWENSFVPANPHRTSRLSSSRAVGHVGVIFFSCGCFYLKVSCPLRSRCRQHITFRGGWWWRRPRSFFTHGQFTVRHIFVFGCKMSTDTNFIISQPLESDPILSRLFNPRPRLMWSLQPAHEILFNMLSI